MILSRDDAIAFQFFSSASSYGFYISKYMLHF